MRFQEVGEVWGCQVVECFVGDEECFEVDSLFDGQPVEIMEDWGDVLSGAGAGEEAGGRVLDILEFIEGFGGDAMENAVAV